MSTTSTTSRRQILQWTAAAAIGVAMRNIAARAADPNDNPAARMFSAKLDVTDLGDGLHLVVNGGGNVLVSRNADGILVIDTGMSFRARDYLAVTETLRPTPGAKSSSTRIGTWTTPAATPTSQRRDMSSPAARIAANAWAKKSPWKTWE